MGLSTGRWKTITPSPFPHEVIALDLVRSILPDRAPVRAWSNFEFLASNGALYEVDLLVVTASGLFLVELKAWSGRIGGDAATWEIEAADGRRMTKDSPYPLTNRKAKALSSLLQQQPAFRRSGLRVPFVEALVFLSAEDVELALPDHARAHVVTREGLVRALLLGDYPGSRPGAHRALIDEGLSKTIDAALSQAGIRRSTSHRRVGDFELGDLLFQGPGFQDFVGRHVTVEGYTRRVRRYNVAQAATPSLRERIRRAALREFRLLAGVDHPNVVQVLDFRDNEFGPCLIFDHRPDTVRLDHFVRQRGPRLTAEQKLDLLEQLVQAVRYMHGQGIYHRALSPEAVLVSDPRGAAPRLQVFCWQTGLLEDGTSGTTHVDRLVSSTAQAYIAPEALVAPHEAREEADVFSLGALAWFLLTGTPPAPDLATLRERLSRDGGLMLSSVMNGASDALHALIYEATRASVADRLPSADAVLEMLEAARAAQAEPEPAPEADPLEAAPGQELPGGYVLRRRLGSGSTAVALLVERGGAPFVLKVARTEDDNERLAQEAEVLGLLRHPHIVALHGVETMAGRAVLVLDHAGESLRARLREDGAFELELLQRLGTDLLDLLVHLENSGIAHRDLKPENVGLRLGGRPERLRPVLFDFSLSRAPASQVRVGTAAYRDPFLDTAGRREWDWYAERYSLAVLLYEMATGTLPVWGDGRSDPALLDEPLPRLDPEQFDAEHRDGLMAFFRRALARDVGDRFDHAEEMRAAWVELFAAASRPPAEAAAGEAAEAPAADSLGDIRLETPVDLLPLSTRARNALDREDVRTVADLLATPTRRFRFMRGVGAKTRRELLALVDRLRPAFGDAVPERPAPAPPAPDQPPRLEDFPALIDRGHGRADHVRRLYLGLKAIEGRPAGAWPTIGDVADALGRSRSAVQAHLMRDRDWWAHCDAVGPLRDAVVALVDEHGGVTPADQIAAGLRQVFPSDEEGERAVRAAAAAARVAVEAELGSDAPRLVVRRADARPLVGRTEAHVDWALELGRLADDLAAEEALLPAPRVLEALRAVEPPAEVVPPEPARLVRLAAAMSRGAAVSARQELYPRGMAAERALRLALGALLGRDALSVDEIRRRVAGRYPEAAPLPDRPALDALLEAAGFPLRWNEGRQVYVQPGGAGATTRQTTTGGVLGERFATATSPPVREIDPEEAEARQFEERMIQAREPGAWLVLTVPRRWLARAEAELTRRYEPEVVSLEAELLAAMKAVAAERRVSWDVVLRADAAAPESRDARNLQRLVGLALDRMIDALAARTPESGHLLLKEAGLLAHFGRLEALERLRARVQAGDLGARTVWVLVPGDRQHTRPVLDGRPIPVLTPAQAADVPRAWIENRHRAA